MGLNCGASCAKYVLFAFNIIFFLGGAAVLGVGIWLRVDSGSFTKFLDLVDPSHEASAATNNIIGDSLSYIYTIAYILIGIGSFVFLVGFMGCCGACKEWRPLLVGYAICLIIIMCTEIGVGIAVGVYKDKVVGPLKTELQTKVLTHYGDAKYDIEGVRRIRPVNTTYAFPARVAETNLMNTLHIALGCCGLTDYRDLIALDVPYSNNGQRTEAPVFCCRMEKPEQLVVIDSTPLCIQTRTKDNSYMNTGCIAKVEELITTYAPAVIGVAVGIGLLELIGIFFAFCLCCAIGDKRKGYPYN